MRCHLRIQILDHIFDETAFLAGIYVELLLLFVIGDIPAGVGPRCAATAILTAFSCCPDLLLTLQLLLLGAFIASSPSPWPVLLVLRKVVLDRVEYSACAASDRWLQAELLRVLWLFLRIAQTFVAFIIVFLPSLLLVSGGRGCGRGHFLRCASLAGPPRQRTLVKLVPEEIGTFLFDLAIHLYQLLRHVAHLANLVGTLL